MRAMPAKSELSPRDLKSFLGDVILCQRVAENPSNYVWRVVGTKVAAVVGDLTGMTFEESAPSGHAARWVECSDLVLDGGRPLRFLGRVRIKDREYLNAENFYVPLSNDEGEPTYILGLCRYTPRRANDEERWEKQIAAISFSADGKKPGISSQAFNVSADIQTLINFPV